MSKERTDTEEGRGQTGAPASSQEAEPHSGSHSINHKPDTWLSLLREETMLDAERQSTTGRTAMWNRAVLPGQRVGLQLLNKMGPWESLQSQQTDE